MAVVKDVSTPTVKLDSFNLTNINFISSLDYKIVQVYGETDDMFLATK